MASGCFDLLAADYDRTWTNSGAGRLQRDAVWRQLLPLFDSGDTVLDLGCGTGEDASHLARLGVRVTAIDASPAMVRIAQGRGVSAEVGSIEGIQSFDEVFDGAISNFGALNCVPELSSLRNPLATLIRSGGHLAICLMGRFCLSESLHFIRKFEFRKAARRWKGQTYAKRLDLPVYYPSANAVTQALTPEFLLMSRVGIGLAVPPSGIANLSPASLRIRGELDARIATWPILRAMADHQLYIFRRR
jgi:ubiquinone/menaquinone biosynthesis C-methylase UbiE